MSPLQACRVEKLERRKILRHRRPVLRKYKFHQELGTTGMRATKSAFAYTFMQIQIPRPSQ